MAKGGNEQIMVAAIDFGTTFSGYAFSFRHEFQKDPLKVVASQWLTGTRAAISLKTSSCILFDKNKQFAAFGFEAEDKYSDLTLDGLDAEWYYFRRFKMQLYNSEVRKLLHFINRNVIERQLMVPFTFIRNDANAPYYIV